MFSNVPFALIHATQSLQAWQLDLLKDIFPQIVDGSMYGQGCLSVCASMK
jgi:hypothetical protein